MSVSEFDLIRQHFAAATAARPDVVLGIGDDAALLLPPPGHLLAVSVDTLVEGRHFLPGTDPRRLGHKALAVNLSDLAAVGAEPAWVTLALTLPTADRAWLTRFMAGFAALAGQHGVQLIGGDTTRGALSITLQVHGFVEPDRALTRSGGRPGDRLFVSGTLGDAALALRRLEALAGATDAIDADLLARLEQPEPRVALGRLLAGHASCAVDISDGLVADLGHLCRASGCGARIDLARLPLSPAVAAAVGDGGWQSVLAGGDDYELLFAVAADRVGALPTRCADAGVPITEIGELLDVPGVAVRDADGHEVPVEQGGYDHFSGPTRSADATRGVS